MKQTEPEWKEKGSSGVVVYTLKQENYGYDLWLQTTHGRDVGLLPLLCKAYLQNQRETINISLCTTIRFFLITLLYQQLCFKWIF